MLPFHCVLQGDSANCCIMCRRQTLDSETVLLLPHAACTHPGNRHIAKLNTTGEGRFNDSLWPVHASMLMIQPQTVAIKMYANIIGWIKASPPPP